MLNSLGRGEGKKVREYEVTLDENTSSKISISLLDNKSQQLAQSQLTSDFVPHLFPLGASLMFSKPLSRFVQQSNVPFFSDNPQKEDLLSSGHNKSEEGSTLYY